MRYRIEFKQITGQELDNHCPFVPDDREYGSGFLSIMNDATWINGVSGVIRDGANAIVVTSDSSLEELKADFVPTLQRNWARLRAISFRQTDAG
jgi:hypothetical protein